MYIGGTHLWLRNLDPHTHSLTADYWMNSTHDVNNGSFTSNGMITSKTKSHVAPLCSMLHPSNKGSNALFSYTARLADDVPANEIL